MDVPVSSLKMELPLKGPIVKEGRLSDDLLDEFPEIAKVEKIHTEYRDCDGKIAVSIDFILRSGEPLRIGAECDVRWNVDRFDAWNALFGEIRPMLYAALKIPEQDRRYREVARTKKVVVRK